MDLCQNQMGILLALFVLGAQTTSGCKKQSSQSEQASVDAILSGDSSQRFKGPCGEGMQEGWQVQSPEEALVRVFNVAPQGIKKLFGNQADRYITLTDNLDCVCKNAYQLKEGEKFSNYFQACWGPAAWLEGCQAKISENKTEAEVETGQNEDQPAHTELALNSVNSPDFTASQDLFRLYLNKSTEVIHQYLLATMAYAYLDADLPSKERCEVWSKSIASEEEQKQYDDLCDPDHRRRKAKHEFARSVLVPQSSEHRYVSPHASKFLGLLGRNIPDLVKVENDQMVMKDVKSEVIYQGLESLAQNEAVQNLIWAESVDSYYCSKTSNEDLLLRLQNAWMGMCEASVANNEFYSQPWHGNYKCKAEFQQKPQEETNSSSF